MISSLGCSFPGRLLDSFQLSYVLKCQLLRSRNWSIFRQIQVRGHNEAQSLYQKHCLPVGSNLIFKFLQDGIYDGNVEYIIHTVFTFAFFPITAGRFSLADQEVVGVERVLRFFQAIVLIVLSHTPLVGLMTRAFRPSDNKLHPLAVTRSILLEVNQRLGQARRHFRVFRFLECFHVANQLYVAVSRSHVQISGEGLVKDPMVEWLQITGHTFNGMWFLLDGATVIDALEIDGLRVLGPELQQSFAMEAQRFWLFALVCGVASGILRVSQLLNLNSGRPTKDKTRQGNAGDNRTDVNSEKHEQDEKNKTKSDVGIVPPESDTAHKGLESNRQLTKLVRNVLSNALDIMLPGSYVGWIRVHPGIVGLSMLITTILTSIDVWERCGRDVLMRKRSSE